MNFSFIIFALYLALLGGVLYSSGISTKSKRAAIEEYFKLSAEQIRIGDKHPLDSRVRKLTLTGWSLAFMMAGIFLIPVAGFGDSMWVQFLSIVGIELGVLLVGLVIIRRFGIMNWYLECCIIDFGFYEKAFFLTICAIIFGNAALVIPFIPWGGVAEVFSVGLMAGALYFLVYPIREEAKYYA